MGVDLVSSTPDEIEPTDPLASVDGLRGFLTSRPWMIDRAAEADLPPLRKLRGELGQVFASAREQRDAEVVAQINHLLERHRPAPSISGHDATDWHLHVADDHAPVAVELGTGAVMGLAMVFLQLGVERLGSCADPRCSGVFVDTSRNRSRRFCSDRCASRANVAAHRARQKAG
jgi:predicted RNA-binding Zn ribbon-like protein